MIRFGLVLLVSLFLSCEKDDICVEMHTPSLIVKFYEHSKIPETSLKVSINSIRELDESDSYLKDISTDSLLIPLSSTKNKLTYILSKKSDENINIDTLIVNYDSKDILSSRACGFYTVYQNVTLNLSKNDKDFWIKDVNIIRSNVEDELSAHVKIFH